MRFTSHTELEIRAALASDPALRAYELDTDTAGGDDVLLGSSRARVIEDVLVWMDRGDDDCLPTGWTLTDVTSEFRS